MERIIKFKAKRLDNDTWVEGYYYKECDNTYIIENRQNESMLNRNEAFLVDPSTVCQFTGLIDKDGKEIYEHDLLKLAPTYVVEVVYKDDRFQATCWDDLSKSAHYTTNLGSKFDRKEGEK